MLKSKGCAEHPGVAACHHVDAAERQGTHHPPACCSVVMAVPVRPSACSTAPESTPASAATSLTAS